MSALQSPAVKNLRHFLPVAEIAALGNGLAGEEADYFEQLIVDTAARIDKMPATYEQDGMGEGAIAHLHYFAPGYDCYVTEKDRGSEDDDIPGAQLQAFGLVRWHEEELGYISIAELIECGVELDLHWAPKPVRECRRNWRPAPIPEPEDRAATIAEFETFEAMDARLERDHG